MSFTEKVKDFEQFHKSKTVRVVQGSVGGRPTRMLLDKDYSGVYMSREHALKQSYISKSTIPGSYGYLGLINIGEITIEVAGKKVLLPVFLSELTKTQETLDGSKWDVILGRSFFEKRKAKLDSFDTRIVTFGDDNDKMIECGLVQLKESPI
ncbi:hypothetical protein E3P91_01847 [Wallemia ichthyophaga]|nr:hypothetical protein E3P91_01847 [Wallemia ichthyophaga]